MGVQFIVDNSSQQDDMQAYMPSTMLIQMSEIMKVKTVYEYNRNAQSTEDIQNSKFQFLMKIMTCLRHTCVIVGLDVTCHNGMHAKHLIC